MCCITIMDCQNSEHSYSYKTNQSSIIPNTDFGIPRSFNLSTIDRSISHNKIKINININFNPYTYENSKHCQS